MKVLLDTGVLRGPAPEPVDAEFAVSAVSLAELHLGVLAAPDDTARAERLRRLAVIERTFDALPVDEVVAREYGRLAAAAITAGRHLRSTDLLVAATANAHGAALWTRNPDAFAGLGELVDLHEPA